MVRRTISFAFGKPRLTHANVMNTFEQHSSRIGVSQGMILVLLGGIGSL
jgi:hypothetical protein